MHHKGHKKPHPLLGSTAKATLVLSIICLTPFCNKIQPKFLVLIHLPKSYLCWIVSNSATSIPILCYIIVRQARKIVCHSFSLSPPPYNLTFPPNYRYTCSGYLSWSYQSLHWLEVVTHSDLKCEAQIQKAMLTNQKFKICHKVWI